MFLTKHCCFDFSPDRCGDAIILILELILIGMFRCVHVFLFFQLVGIKARGGNKNPRAKLALLFREKNIEK